MAMQPRAASSAIQVAIVFAFPSTRAKRGIRVFK
jgi:hypothetical protein